MYGTIRIMEKSRQNKDYGYDIQKVYLEMMLGNAEAFAMAAGYGPNELLQIGFDTSPQVMSGFVNGYAHLTSDQQPFLQGYLPILSLCQMKVLGTGALNQDTGAGFVNTENYESVMELANAGLR